MATYALTISASRLDPDNVTDVIITATFTSDGVATDSTGDVTITPVVDGVTASTAENMTPDTNSPGVYTYTLLASTYADKVVTVSAYAVSEEVSSEPSDVITWSGDVFGILLSVDNASPGSTDDVVVTASYTINTIATDGKSLSLYDSGGTEIGPLVAGTIQGEYKITLSAADYVRQTSRTLTVYAEDDSDPSISSNTQNITWTGTGQVATSYTTDVTNAGTYTRTNTGEFIIVVTVKDGDDVPLTNDLAIVSINTTGDSFTWAGDGLYDCTLTPGTDEVINYTISVTDPNSNAVGTATSFSVTWGTPSTGGAGWALSISASTPAPDNATDVTITATLTDGGVATNSGGNVTITVAVGSGVPAAPVNMTPSGAGVYTFVLPAIFYAGQSVTVSANASFESATSSTETITWAGDVSTIALSVDNDVPGSTTDVIVTALYTFNNQSTSGKSLTLYDYPDANVIGALAASSTTGEYTITLLAANYVKQLDKTLTVYAQDNNDTDIVSGNETITWTGTGQTVDSYGANVTNGEEILKPVTSETFDLIVTIYDVDGAPFETQPDVTVKLGTTDMDWTEATKDYRITIDYPGNDETTSYTISVVNGTDVLGTDTTFTIVWGTPAATITLTADNTTPGFADSVVLTATLSDNLSQSVLLNAPGLTGFDQATFSNTQLDGVYTLQITGPRIGSGEKEIGVSVTDVDNSLTSDGITITWGAPPAILLESNYYFVMSGLEGITLKATAWDMGGNLYSSANITVGATAMVQDSGTPGTYLLYVTNPDPTQTNTAEYTADDLGLLSNMVSVEWDGPALNNPHTLTASTTTPGFADVIELVATISDGGGGYINDLSDLIVTSDPPVADFDNVPFVYTTGSDGIYTLQFYGLRDLSSEVGMTISANSAIQNITTPDLYVTWGAPPAILLETTSYTPASDEGVTLTATVWGNNGKFLYSENVTVNGSSMTEDAPSSNYWLYVTNPDPTQANDQYYIANANQTLSDVNSNGITITWGAPGAVVSQILLAASNEAPTFAEIVTLTATLPDNTATGVTLNAPELPDFDGASFINTGSNGLYTLDVYGPRSGSAAQTITVSASSASLLTSLDVVIVWAAPPDILLVSNNYNPNSTDGVTLAATIWDNNGNLYANSTTVNIDGVTMSEYVGNTGQYILYVPNPDPTQTNLQIYVANDNYNFPDLTSNEVTIDWKAPVQNDQIVLTVNNDQPSFAGTITVTATLPDNTANDVALNAPAIPDFDQELFTNSNSDGIYTLNIYGPRSGDTEINTLLAASSESLSYFSNFIGVTWGAPPAILLEATDYTPPAFTGVTLIATVWDATGNLLNGETFSIGATLMSEYVGNTGQYILYVPNPDPTQENSEKYTVTSTSLPSLGSSNEIGVTWSAPIQPFSASRSVLRPEYVRAYVGDSINLIASILDTNGNPYSVDYRDRVDFYAGSTLLGGTTLSTNSEYKFPVQGSSAGVSPVYSAVYYQHIYGTAMSRIPRAALAAGQTLGSTGGITFSNLGISLGSPITPSFTSVYCDRLSDGATFTVVLYDINGALYNPGSTFYVGDYKVRLTNNGSISGSEFGPDGVSGSTYTIRVSSYSPNVRDITYDRLYFDIVNEDVVPYYKQSTSYANLQLFPRNTFSAVTSRMEFNPAIVTNGTNVTATVRLFDPFDAPVFSLNPVTIYSTVGATGSVASGLTFIKDSNETTLTAEQALGETGVYNFNFSISNAVNKTFYINAVYNGITFADSQIDSISYYPNDPSLVPCFLADAPVLTSKGYRRIDKIKAGDILVTPDDRRIAVKRVVSTKVTATRETNPYIIPKGKFGAFEKLLISPNHKVNVKGTMIEAKNLGLTQEYKSGTLSYYNIELEKPGNMLVAGVDVETLIVAKEVLVTPEQFMASLKKRYGNVSQEMHDQMLSKFKIMPDGRIRCFTRTN